MSMSVSTCRAQSDALQKSPMLVALGNQIQIKTTKYKRNVLQVRLAVFSMRLR